MKIEPIKNYKKPKYAAALAAVTAVSTMSGCIPMSTPGIAPMPVDTTTYPTTAEFTTAAPTGTVTTASDLEVDGGISVVTEKTLSEDEKEIDEFCEMYRSHKEYFELYVNAFKNYSVDLLRTDINVEGDFAFGTFYDETHNLVIAFSKGNVNIKDFQYYKVTEYGNFAVTSTDSDNPELSESRFDTRMVAYIDMEKNPIENLDKIVSAIVINANSAISMFYVDIPLINGDEVILELAGDVAFIPDEEQE